MERGNIIKVNIVKVYGKVFKLQFRLFQKLWLGKVLSLSKNFSRCRLVEKKTIVVLKISHQNTNDKTMLSSYKFCPFVTCS